jgi:hypothetical protein
MIAALHFGKRSTISIVGFAPLHMITEKADSKIDGRPVGCFEVINK